MASNAFSGVGTLFQISDMTSSPAFTTLAEINDITGPDIAVGTIDVTSLDSTGGYREFIASFIDGGTVALNMNFTQVSYNTLLTLINAREVVDIQIVLPDSGNSTFELSGLPVALGAAVPNDDKVTATASFKITGEVTLAS